MKAIPNKTLRKFLFVLLIYNFFIVCTFTDSIDVSFCHIIEFGSVMYIFLQKKKIGWSKYDKIIIPLLLVLIIWYVFIIFNNIGSAFTNIGLTFIDNQGIASLLLLIITPHFSHPKNLKYILDFAFVCSIIYILFLFYKVPYIISLFQEAQFVHADTIFESIHTYIGGGLIFLVLFQNFFNKKVKIVINVIALITIVFSALLARRGILLIYSFVYISFFIVYTSFFSKKKIIPLILSIFIICGLTFFISLYGEEYLGYLYERMLVDTRSETENELLQDLANTNDLLLGRGISGTYYSQSIEQEYRAGIETGYLNLVLKGGWVYVALFVLFVTPAIVKGLFSSKNHVVKMMAIYSIIWFFYFNTASANMSLSIRYFFFLYCIFICYTPYYRNMTDSQILQIL